MWVCLTISFGRSHGGSVVQNGLYLEAIVKGHVVTVLRIENQPQPLLLHVIAKTSRHQATILVLNK